MDNVRYMTGDVLFAIDSLRLSRKILEYYGLITNIEENELIRFEIKIIKRLKGGEHENVITNGMDNESNGGK